MGCDGPCGRCARTGWHSRHRAVETRERPTWARRYDCCGRGALLERDHRENCRANDSCMACGKNVVGCLQPGETKSRPDLTSARPSHRLVLKMVTACRWAAYFGPFHQRLPSFDVPSAAKMSSSRRNAVDATVRLSCSFFARKSVHARMDHNGDGGVETAQQLACETELRRFLGQ